MTHLKNIEFLRGETTTTANSKSWSLRKCPFNFGLEVFLTMPFLLTWWYLSHLFIKTVPDRSTLVHHFFSFSFLFPFIFIFFSSFFFYLEGDCLKRRINLPVNKLTTSDYQGNNTTLNKWAKVLREHTNIRTWYHTIIIALEWQYLPELDLKRSFFVISIVVFLILLNHLTFEVRVIVFSASFNARRTVQVRNVSHQDKY
jgi:hypothetical protein